ncbi:MAG TPA: trypsin-like peptidase domain-containing protein [Bacillota bacterium]|nr:trypsin-like peptidase domain-containing protein [Bacillota bacterium]
MNEFRFDSHTPRERIPYIFTALISGTIAAFLVILAIKYTGLGQLLVNSSEPFIQIQTQSQAQTQASTMNDYEKNIIDVVNRIGPSVVMITTNTLVEDFDFFSGPEIRNIQGLGSGVVFRKDGYILTNNHVVNGDSGIVDKIVVMLSDGKSYPAKIVGVDPQTDLAVLKINHNNLTVPEWGDSEKVQVGQTAIAIGNPLQESLNNTVTVGVVSAKGRVIDVSDEIRLRNMIQTDAPINPGNSGGPLLNSAGQVIGINTLIAAKSQGIGFSIPSNMARSVAAQLIERGYVSRPGLGIAYVHFTEDNCRILETRIGQELPVKSGIFIAKVLRGSEADKAGLRPGDILVSIDGTKITDTDLVREITATHKVGTPLKIEYYRNDKKYRTTVKIGEMRQ